jgi:hypothetical protein
MVMAEGAGPAASAEDHSKINTLFDLRHLA